MNYETIKRNYDKGLWNKALVRMAATVVPISAAVVHDI